MAVAPVDEKVAEVEQKVEQVADLAEEEEDGDAAIDDRYYARVGGMQVDRTLWAGIELHARKGRISLPDARKVWARAHDGPGVTACEVRTIRLAIEQFGFTDGARKFLEECIAEADEDASAAVTAADEERQAGRPEEKEEEDSLVGTVVSTATARGTPATEVDAVLCTEEALSALTVVQLKERLRAAGLRVTGRKAELVARLRDHAGATASS